MSPLVEYDAPDRTRRRYLERRPTARRRGGGHRGLGRRLGLVGGCLVRVALLGGSGELLVVRAREARAVVVVKDGKELVACEPARLCSGAR